MRKALIVLASIASVVIGGYILAGAAMLQYQPAPQHVELEITPAPQCNGQPCGAWPDSAEMCLPGFTNWLAQGFARPN
jgi:hypothetical protein